MKGIDLSISTLYDIEQKDYKIAILPWGATEPHNKHLPYLTDSILSHRISLDVAKEVNAGGVDCIVLPPISMGSQNPGQRDLPFCIHTSYATQFAILSDIVESLSHQGFDKLIIVNGHGGNVFKNMVRDLATTKPDFMIASCEWYKIVPTVRFFENEGDHAGDLETSVMLHYHPEYVDMGVAGSGASKPFAIDALNKGKVWIPRNWLKVSEDTGIGDPRSATADKGRIYIEAVVTELKDIVIQLATESVY